MPNVQLLIIDPQVDFCDPQGSLYVPGADNDMKRLAEMVRKNKSKIDDIRVTIDSHRTVDIAHPIFWMDKKGYPPAPFTLINIDDVEGMDPKWTTKNPGFRKRAIDYIRKLKENNRYILCIWPPHCLIGSNGHKVYPDLFKALQEWEEQFRIVDFVPKGANIFTEHYSAVKADVPDPEDPATQINTNFIRNLQKADLIGISGEALSHCVASTVRDIATEFGEDQVKKFVLIKDTCSPVPGFENLADDFVRDMTAKGMQTCTASEFLA